MQNIGDDINYRAARYLVARSAGECRHCNRATALFALGLEPGHHTYEDADDTEERGAAHGSWSVARHSALLFHVGYLSPAVQRHLADLAPSFRLERALPEKERCWLNHCVQCGEPCSDDELFCEPGGAFLPMSASDARRIHLLTVDEPFEAGAGGYACEPAFFDLISRD